MNVAVVGGGVSGLAAAWAAVSRGRDLGRELEVVVLEAGQNVGGKAQSVRKGAWLHECGPLGFMDDAPELMALLDELGIKDDAVVASPESYKHRYLVRDGDLLEIPAHPIKFARAGIVSSRALLRAAREPFVRRWRGDGDETVWDFAARRLGPEFADRIISPMTLGVFAGDAHKLSLRSAFPKMARLEAEHGSLIRGAIAQKRQGKRRGVLRSFADGVQTLPLKLADCGAFSVRTGARVAEVNREGERWRIAMADRGEPVVADAVILACEAWSAAGLVQGTSAKLAELFGRVSFPPVAVVAAAFDGRDCERVPRGFGALIPREEGIRTLGITWDSRLFANRCGEGQVLVRAILGGAVDRGIGKLSEEEISAIARAELKRVLKVSAEPIFTSVKLWQRAIPQYEVGHQGIVDGVEEILGQLPGAFVAGNSLYGTAFAQSAVTGLQVGRRAAEWLGRQS